MNRLGQYAARAFKVIYAPSSTNIFFHVIHQALQLSWRNFINIAVVTHKPLNNVFWCVSNLAQILIWVLLSYLLNFLEKLNKLEIVIVLGVRVLA